MTNKCVSSLGFLKRLNTLGDPRHPVYLPREHCFEVQKMKIKVTGDGDTQNQGNWHLKGTLRKEWIVSRKGEGEVMPIKEKEEVLGWGRCRFGGV